MEEVGDVDWASSDGGRAANGTGSRSAESRVHHQLPPPKPVRKIEATRTEGIHEREKVLACHRRRFGPPRLELAEEPQDLAHQIRRLQSYHLAAPHRLEYNMTRADDPSEDRPGAVDVVCREKDAFVVLEEEGGRTREDRKRRNAEYGIRCARSADQET